MNELSWLTAIRRSRMSLPCKWLLDHGFIRGRVLDFGCGFGMDGHFLGKRGFDYQNFDPHFFPWTPDGQFDTILCTYVFNVLFAQERFETLKELKSYMKADTRTFITVRRDYPPKELFMVKSKLGTYQFYVELELPVIFENRKFCIYELSKNTEL